MLPVTQQNIKWKIGNMVSWTGFLRILGQLLIPEDQRDQCELMVLNWNNS